MPVDPTNQYVDTPHAKTIGLASQGWRYGCHSEKVGPGHRGRGPTFKSIPCGHSERADDTSCHGCENRHKTN